MKLYASPRSPFVRKVRIALAEKKISCDLILDRKGIAEVNPLSKVPSLIRDDGKALYDSPVIVEYLDGLVPKPKLIPEAFEARIEVKRWEALGDGVADATVAISHDRVHPEAKRQDSAWYAKQQLKVDLGLAQMARDLGDRTFCHGDSFSLADIATGYALCYLDLVLPEVDWRTPHPNLKRLMERYAARDSFKLTAPPAA